MSTFTFKKVSGGSAKFSKGGDFIVPSLRPSFKEAADYLGVSIDGVDCVIYPATDTVVIDGVTSAPGSFTVSALSDALNVLFPKANSSSGGTGYVSFFNNSDAPANPLVNDGGTLYEFGLRFKSSVSGFVKSIKFYKGAGATGTHIGRIWAANGAKIAEVAFTNETASGWQSMNLPTPVALTAEDIYVVSIFSSTGDYCFTTGYFTEDKTVSVLTAPGTNNGVYNNASSASPGVFPSTIFNSANYFVDVVYFSVSI